MHSYDDGRGRERASERIAVGAAQLQPPRSDRARSSRFDDENELVFVSRIDNRLICPVVPQARAQAKSPCRSTGEGEENHHIV